MNSTILRIGVLTLGASLILSACSKKEEAPATPALPKEASESQNQLQQQVNEAATQVKSGLDQAAEQMKQQASQMQQQAEQQATQVQQQASSALDASSLIEKAKSFIDAKNYPEASKILDDLSKLSLTADQQKVIEDLKAAVQKGLSSALPDTSKAAEGLLK